MSLLLTKLRTATLMTILLAGCDSSDVTAVKKATVSKDQTHTYETALSGRASCDSEEWRTFKDDNNRTAVEYRCALKSAPELIAAMRVRKINEVNKDFQNYYQALDQRAEEIKQAPAFEARHAAEAKQKLAQTEADEAKANQQFAHEDPVSAMKRAAVRNEIGSLASARFIAERSQQSANDAASNLERNLASLQREKGRFEQDEKNALAAIEKSYGGITKATEILQWVVKGDEVFPSWAGVEFQKQDGTTIRVNKNWSMYMRDILHYRGDDHVRYALDVPGDVVPGQLNATEPSAKKASSVPIQEAGNSKEVCYANKLKNLKEGMGEEAPVSNDMMQEWRSQCGLPST
jgi:hypothetical protein